MAAMPLPSRPSGSRDCPYSSEGREYVAGWSSHGDVGRIVHDIVGGRIRFPLKRYCMHEDVDVRNFVRELCNFDLPLRSEPFEVWGYYSEHRALPWLDAAPSEQSPPDLPPGQVHPDTRRLEVFNRHCFAWLPSDNDAHVRFAALVDFYNEHVRVRSSRSDEPGSPETMFRSPDKARDIVERARRKYGRISEFTLRHAMFSVVQGCNVFKPEAARAIYRYFGARRVLDISAGWGDRMAGALSLDSVEAYLGFDPNTSLADGHSGLIEAFIRYADHRPAEVTRRNFRVRYEPFEKADLSNEGAFDVVFTSPPFFTLETYVSSRSEDHQSASDYPELDQWKRYFLFESMRKAMDVLVFGGHLIIYINDIQGFEVCHDMLAFAARELRNCEFKGVVGLESEGSSSRMRPCWVWRKTLPDPLIYRELAARPVFQPLRNPFRDSPLVTSMLTQCRHMASMNPVLDVMEVCTGPWGQLPDRKVLVIRDDRLPGGTKQRALASFIASRPEREFVYPGPVHGYAQLALALSVHAAQSNPWSAGERFQHRVRQGTLFVDLRRPRHPLTDLAEALGATIHEMGTAADHTPLWQVESAAKSYVTRRNSLEPGSTALMPFGLGSPEYLRLLVESLNSAGIKRLGPAPHVWLVAGSGTIARALRLCLPQAVLHCVQVGKELPGDVRHAICSVRGGEVLVAPQAFEEQAAEAELPPFPSVANYDAKLWAFVRRHARAGDYVWNVGRDHDPTDVPDRELRAISAPLNVDTPVPTASHPVVITESQIVDSKLPQHSPITVPSTSAAPSAPAPESFDGSHSGHHRDDGGGADDRAADHC